ncbi:hypothetical protein H2198_007892 [Neophaeococcomyces mojaviensis]|uniref:Uncharacterized protein n=1 Tax=Neophaeococcomyces mojaviensis TaxID=3383035 RepID=A0ACC2ZYW1_9EURO|nr:hypothetical protein H2198_007892 [Knufia sp. JES_112]
MASTGNLTWLITGSSSGFGLALSQHILKAKHNLVSVSRHASPDQCLLDLSSGSSSPTLHHIQVDLSVSNPAAIKQPITIFLAQHPDIQIDIVINNAAITHFAPLEYITPEILFETMNVNFYSPLWMTQALLPHLRSSKNGLEKVIVNISSTQGKAADPSEVAYDASKHALEALSTVLAAEVAPFGIRTIVANLGSFRTQFSGKGSYHNVASESTSKTAGDADEQVQSSNDPYGENHPVAVRMRMVASLSSNPTIARGDPAKGAAVLFDAVTRKGAVDEALQKQRRWSSEKGDGKGRVERLVLGSDSQPKMEDVARQFVMEVESCRDVSSLANADDVK